MATTTTADVRLSALPPVAGRAGMRGVLASEFTKLRSVRSTYWTIAALVIFSVGLAALLGLAQASNLHNNPWNKAGFDATQLSIGAFVQFGVCILWPASVRADTTLRLLTSAAGRGGPVYFQLGSVTPRPAMAAMFME